MKHKRVSVCEKQSMEKNWLGGAGEWRWEEGEVNVNDTPHLSGVADKWWQARYSIKVMGASQSKQEGRKLGGMNAVMRWHWQYWSV